jgi:SAM-dependent methyltransferase
VSAWLARRGARPVGIDNSEAQLATARRLQQEFGLEFPLVHGNAEDVPLPDGSFDFAISEYGASIWCDPYRWIPEAARLLRPGGRLVFLANAVLLMLCAPDEEDAPVGDRLVRPYFGMHRIEWPDDHSVEFHLAHGEMIALLRKCGFEVDALTEVRPPDGSTTSYPWVTLEGTALAVRGDLDGSQGCLGIAPTPSVEPGKPGRARAIEDPTRRRSRWKPAPRRPDRSPAPGTRTTT